VMMIVVVIFIVIALRRCRCRRFFGLWSFARAPGQKNQSTGNQRNNQPGCEPTVILRHECSLVNINARKETSSLSRRGSYITGKFSERSVRRSPCRRISNGSNTEETRIKDEHFEKEQTEKGRIQ